MSPFNLQHNAGDYCHSTDGETESGSLHDLFKTTEPVSSSSSSDSSQVFFPWGSCSFRVPDFPNRVPPISICEATGLRGFSDPRHRKRDAAGQFSGSLTVVQEGGGALSVSWPQVTAVEICLLGPSG